MAAPIARATVMLSFQPSHRFVQRIVEWLTDFCHLTLEDLDVASRLHLAAHELVENLAKYGKMTCVHIEVELERGEHGLLLRLCTKNAAEPHEIEQASRILTGLRNANDPVEYYDGLVLKSAPKYGESGLGLARIKAEAEFDVDFSVEGDELSIVVETRMDEVRS